METAPTSTLSKWYHKFWPIRRFELKKLIPLIILKFLVSFIYAIFNCMKDPLVITAQGGGAEVIPILKSFFVLPLALVCAILYSKLSNKYKPSTLFYGIISFFLLFALTYGFFLYPNLDVVTPHKSADWLSQVLGAKHSHWVAIYRNWCHSLFFIMSELWATLVIFLLFWGFANKITTVCEAKRTYTLMIAAGDIATIVTGHLVGSLMTRYFITDYILPCKILISIAVALGVCMIGTYWWMHKYVLIDKRYFDPAQAREKLDQKTKLSLWNSFKSIAKSRYLLYIAVMVFACALCINTIELTWKAAVKVEYPTLEAYQTFSAHITSIFGYIALLTVFFLSGNLLRLFGWHFSAQITPIALGAGGALFFLLIIMRDHLTPVASFFNTTPMMFLVIFGACQFVLGKVVKYSFFDSTKEMAFIPLDQEAKVKGKAAIDMVGSRLGKSGSSILSLGLIDLVGTGSVLSIAPYLLPVLITVAVCWSLSVKAISKEFSTEEAEPATTS